MTGSKIDIFSKNELAFHADSEGDKYCLVDAYLESQNSELGRNGLKSSIRTLSRIYFSEYLATDPDVFDHVANKPRDLSPIWSRVPWHMLHKGAVIRLMAGVEGAPATRRKALSALKGIANAGHDLDVISSDTLVKIEKTKGPKSKRLRQGRVIPEVRQREMFEICESEGTPRGLRDAAMLAVALCNGLRRFEIASLGIGDLLEEESDYGPILAGTIIGKGDKEREMILLNQYRQKMVKWMECRGSDPGWLFCPISKTGKIRTNAEHRMSLTAIHNILKRRAEQCHFDISWHDFRRTCITTLMRLGIDIGLIAAIVGHDDVKTTASYDIKQKNDIIAALSKL